MQPRLALNLLCAGATLELLIPAGRLQAFRTKPSFLILLMFYTAQKTTVSVEVSGAPLVSNSFHRVAPKDGKKKKTVKMETLLQSDRFQNLHTQLD